MSRPKDNISTPSAKCKHIWCKKKKRRISIGAYSTWDWACRIYRIQEPPWYMSRVNCPPCQYGAYFKCFTHFQDFPHMSGKYVGSCLLSSFHLLRTKDVRYFISTCDAKKYAPKSYAYQVILSFDAVFQNDSFWGLATKLPANYIHLLHNLVFPSFGEKSPRGLPNPNEATSLREIVCHTQKVIWFCPCDIG